MINCVVTGNLGKDSELRDAGSTRVLSFSVASTKKVKGEKLTTWVRCSLWGARGEKMAKYLKQGCRLAVSGDLTTREYNGKTYLELNVNDVHVLQYPKDASDQPAAATAQDFGPTDYGDAGEGLDDLPF